MVNEALNSIGEKVGTTTKLLRFIGSLNYLFNYPDYLEWGKRNFLEEPNPRCEMVSFLINNGPNIDNFIDLFEKDPSLKNIALVSSDLYFNTYRKVNKQPYFKHPFYTAYLCFEQAGNLKFEEDDSQKRIFIGSALLHDAIEIKRKNHEELTEENLIKQLLESGINESEAKKITTIVSFLTPPEKDNSKLSSRQWMSKKRENFGRIMNQKPSEELPLELLEMAKQINIADDAASLRETVEDVRAGNDGPNKEIYDHKPFTNRVAVLKERISIIADKYPNHLLLPQLQTDFRFLFSKLPLIKQILLLSF